MKHDENVVYFLDMNGGRTMRYWHDYPDAHSAAVCVEVATGHRPKVVKFEATEIDGKKIEESD